MKKSYTTDYDEWNAKRTSGRSHPAFHGPDYGVVQLPLPAQLKCKGYALSPVMTDDEGNQLECKSRVVKDGESLMDYDFSNCYIHDYMLIFSEVPQLNENFEIEQDKPWHVVIGRKIRFAGEAVKK